MTKYLFTFSFQGSAKILTDVNNELEEPPFVSVYSSNYHSAVKKILKLRLPNVESEDDLMFMSCQEEVNIDDLGEKDTQEA